MSDYPEAILGIVQRATAAMGGKQPLQTELVVVMLAEAHAAGVAQGRAEERARADEAEALLAEITDCEDATCTMCQRNRARFAREERERIVAMLRKGAAAFALEADIGEADEWDAFANMIEADHG